MENRRQHYRHSFRPTEKLKVQLRSLNGGSALQGSVVNMSIGGMCVESVGLESIGPERLQAVIELEADAPPVSVAVERVYSQSGSQGQCGFRFLLPANINKREDLERHIAKFLLEEQRSERRRLREKNTTPVY